jgi:hypothetical protein
LTTDGLTVMGFEARQGGRGVVNDCM